MKKDPSLKILVIQPLPGIGDLFWFDGALQSLSDFYKEPLVLMTKPQSRAQDIYGKSPYVSDVLWLERPGKHQGILGFLRLILFLKREKFSHVWIFHKSWRYRWICKLAGVPSIFSYPPKAEFLKKHPIDRVTTLLVQHKIPLLKNPKFPVLPTAMTAVKKKLSSQKKPWVALGIGGTEPSKKWAQNHWEDLGVWLSQVHDFRVFLLGGPREKEEAQSMVRAIEEKGGEAQALTQFSLQESLAFLDQVKFFVGNDTGMMNGAVVLNRPTFALFLSSPVLGYRPNLMAISSVDHQDILLSQVQKTVDEWVKASK